MGKSIDVGEAVGDGYIKGSGRTFIESSNIANASGIITYVEMEFSTLYDSYDIRVGSFYYNSGWYTRGWTAISGTHRGLCMFDAEDGDFTPFAIGTGDRLGFYCYGGVTAYGAIGQGEEYNGAAIPATGQVFGTDGYSYYCYAEGYQLGKVNIGDAWKEICNIQVNVGDDWKQILPGSKINIGDAWKDICH